MQDYFVALVLGLPVLTMAVAYCFPGYVWLFGRGSRVPRDYSLKPTVSVMLPCFNEGKHVYETIKSLRACNYPQDKLQIVAIDDCSKDDSYRWIQKAAAEFGNVAVARNEVNLGKTRTVLRASHLTTGDFLVTVDSDTVFHPEAISELMACYTEPDIAAVGGRVGIINANETIVTQSQTFFYYLCFFFPKTVENFVRTVGCVSGCLSSARRGPYMAMEAQLKARNFCGVAVDDGDDRFITQSLLYGNYKTYVNVDAQCWTKSPLTMCALFGQQLRWRRSAIRSWMIDLKMLLTGRNRLHPLGALYLFLPPGALCIMVSLTFMMLASGSFAELIGFLGLHIVSMALGGLIFNAVVKHKNPEQVITNPFAFMLLPVWLFVDYFFITMLAACTLDFGGWGTREAAAHVAPQPHVAAPVPAVVDAAAALVPSRRTARAVLGVVPTARHPRLVALEARLAAEARCAA